MTEPTIAQKAPYQPPSRRARPTIGAPAASPPISRSATAAQGSGMFPKPYTAEKEGTAYLCGCKATKNAPLCDGTHKSL